MAARAPSEFSPDSWLRGIDIVGADGDNVGTWTDAIAGRSYTASGVDRPTLKTGIGIRNRQGVYFNGSSSFLLLSGAASVYDFMHDGTDNTFFAVFVVLNGSKEQWLWASNDGDTGNTGASFILNDDDALSHTITKGSAGNPIINNDGAAALGADGVTIEWVFVTYDNGAAGDDAAIYINGSSDTTAETMNTPHTAGAPTNQPIIGRRNSSSAEFFDGYLLEMGFIESALSASQLAELDEWFTAYYNTAEVEYRDVGTPVLTYSSVDIDFPKKFNSYRAVESTARASNESTAGIVENLKFYERYDIEVEKTLIPAGLKDQLITFYNAVNDGTAFSFEYDDDIGIYMPFEGKSLETNDGTAGSTTRADAANYVDASTGLVTSAAANIARYEQGKFNNHAILVERAVTNYAQYSEEFDNANWAKTNVTVTANVAYLAAPDGTFTADRLDFTNASNSVIYASGQAVSTQGVYSIWLRSLDEDESNVLLRLDGNAGPPDFDSTVTVTPQWQRFEVASTSAPTGNWRIWIVKNGTIPATLFAWGAQVEDGEEVAQSYIQGTGGADGTTNNEHHTVAIDSTADLSLTAGSLSFWLYPNFNYDDGLERWMFKIENASNEDFLRVLKNSSNNMEAQMRLADDSGAGGTASGSASYLNASSWDNHIVVTWDTTTANGINIYHNGTLRHTSSNNPFAPIQVPTNLHIGKVTSASLGGRLDEVCLWKKILSSTEVSRLYNATTAMPVGRNRWDSVKLLDFDISEQTPGTKLWNFTARFQEVKS